jgi:hypothetical protein
MAIETGSFRLGDTVELTVELKAKRNVEIAEGRVELECEERYIETYTRTHEIHRSPGIIMPGRRQVVAAAPTREVREIVTSFVHSSVVFLKDLELRSGAVSSFKVRLEIQHDMPAHAGSGTLTWTLRTGVRDAFDRDFTETREIEVALK